MSVWRVADLLTDHGKDAVTIEADSDEGTVVLTFYDVEFPETRWVFTLRDGEANLLGRELGAAYKELVREVQ